MFRAYTCRTYSQTIFEPQKYQRLAFFGPILTQKEQELKMGLICTLFIFMYLVCSVYFIMDIYLIYLHIPGMFILF